MKEMVFARVLLGVFIVVGSGLAITFGIRDFVSSDQAQTANACWGYEYCWSVSEDTYDPYSSYSTDPYIQYLEDPNLYPLLPDDVYPPDIVFGPAVYYEAYPTHDMYIDPYEGGYGEIYEIEEEYYAPVYTEPWYSRSFPGFGTFFQPLIPPPFAPRPVVAPPVPARPLYPQPSCWISVQPANVPSGGSATITWSSHYASRATLSGFGEVPTSGTRTVNDVTNSHTYTLSVAGEGGSGSCYGEVRVFNVR